MLCFQLRQPCFAGNTKGYVLEYIGKISRMRSGKHGASLPEIIPPPPPSNSLIKSSYDTVLRKIFKAWTHS